MKVLAILRGVPGCGKSSFICDNELEEYTLCPDDYRVKLGAVRVNSDGTKYISQKCNNEVWGQVFKDLEYRMSQGIFTIIDATHTKDSAINQYKKLCDTYRYRMVVVDFVALEDINEEYQEKVLEQNRNRKPSYKVVPDSVIINMLTSLKQSLKQKTFEKISITPTEFVKQYVYPTCVLTDESIQKNYYVIDAEKYHSVIFVGDIHGCYTALENGLEACEGLIHAGGLDDSTKDLDPNTMYVFCGDYIDRGLENADVIDFLYDIKDLPNVLLIEGNHESHILKLNGKDSDKYRELIPYAKETIRTIEGLTEDRFTKLRVLARKCRQIVRLKFNGDFYQVTHAATPYPVNDIEMSSMDITKGFGVSPYIDSDMTDECWTKYVKEHFQCNFYSVHGHANVNNVEIHNTEFTFNLCDTVEHGGNLRILKVTKD